MGTKFDRLLAKQPVFVVERSEFNDNDVVEAAKAACLPDSAIESIKKDEICCERWQLSNPTIYIIHPARTQVSIISFLSYCGEREH